MAIIDDKFDLIDGANDDLLKALKGVDKDLAKEIIKIYSRFVVGRDLVLDAQQLAQLDEAIITAIANTDYKLAIDAYIPNFDVLKALNTELHKEINGINAQDVLLEADRIKNHQSMIEAQLRGQNSVQIQVTAEGTRRLVPLENNSLNELVKPISDMIRQDVILGHTFESATQTMLDAIEAGQLGLKQWAGQIARDALNQSDGLQQQQIKEEFGLKYSRYVGTIKQTTRPICYHMLTKKNEPVYTDKELASILKEYVPNGVPSESTTTSTANGKQQKKGGGIIPGTDVGNFHVRRGGHNCRHQYIPSKVGPEEDVPEELVTESQGSLNDLKYNEKISEDKILYRGDVYDKGNEFSKSIKDYQSTQQGEKNRGWYFLTNSEDIARKYASGVDRNISVPKGKKLKPNVVKVKVGKLNILDMTQKNNPGQPGKFYRLQDTYRMLSDIKDSPLTYEEIADLYGFAKKEDFLKKFNEKMWELTSKQHKELFDIMTGKNKNTLSYTWNPVDLSNFDNGPNFKKFLKKYGYDGYKFEDITGFGGEDYAIFNEITPKIVDKINL